MRSKKIFFVLFLIIAICGIALFALWQSGILEAKTPEEKWAEETILAYLEAKGLDIRPGTDEYNNFLKGITLGQVPELTKPPSAFVKNATEAYYIERYAIDHYQLPDEWQIVEQTEEPGFEAKP